MADNNSSSDSSVNDVVVPYWENSDSGDSSESIHSEHSSANSPPGIVDPYIDPHDISALPHVLEGWRRDMMWPRYAPSQFNPNDYPIIREPPHYTTPILVARLRDVETNVNNLENAVDELATHQEVTSVRNQVGILKQNLIGFSEAFNHNATMMENHIASHNTLVDELNANLAIDTRHMKSFESRIRALEKMVRKPPGQASSSRPKRARSS